MTEKAYQQEQEPEEQELPHPPELANCMLEWMVKPM